jgi:nucleotidyltransferase substrate binding protein (TIGR01987 family)
MEKQSEDKPRWVYRFENYTKAFSLLRSAIELMQERDLSALEQEGTIQRFEFTWELAWKLLKDYLESQGVNLPAFTPKSVINAALNAKIIRDGEHWLLALDDRNRMSHVYDYMAFSDVISHIETTYLALFDDLNLSFLEKRDEL